MFDVPRLMFDFKPSPQSSPFTKGRGGCAGLSRNETRVAANAFLSSSNEERIKDEESTNNQSITERNVDIARGMYELSVRRNKLQAIDCFGNGHVVHLVVLITHH